MSDATATDLLREAEAKGGWFGWPSASKPTQVVDGKSTGKRSGRSSRRQDAYQRFSVDVWLTDLNPTEFGFYKRSRNKAKSRQFTSDMDIFAEVLEDGERTGLLGYRADLWKKQTGFDKRLVFKLFSETLNWRATMDLMLARSVQETVGARGLPVTCFALNSSEHEQVVYIERSANKWWLLPEHFSFFLIDGKEVKFYRLKQEILSIGRDYVLFDGAGRRIGLLDGKLLTLGGMWHCKVRTEHADRRLMTVLKMFVGMLTVNNACRRHVKGLYRDMRAGKVTPKLERMEGDLYMNPRRVR